MEEEDEGRKARKTGRRKGGKGREKGDEKKKEKGTEKCERRKQRGQREQIEKRAGATIDNRGGLLAVCRHMTWARAGMRSVRVSFPPPPAIASWVTCGRVVS